MAFQAGLPLLAAAFQSREPEVRAELVRSAKTIGGPVAEYAVQTALADPDESLRQAAEKALEEAKANVVKTTARRVGCPRPKLLRWM